MEYNDIQNLEYGQDLPAVAAIGWSKAKNFAACVMQEFQVALCFQILNAGLETRRIHMKGFGGGIQYIADEKEFIFVRVLGHIVEDSARQFIHEITSFRWDFTTGMEGEQEGRRENMRVVINGTAKEIAALVVELQGQILAAVRADQWEIEKRKRLERISSVNFSEEAREKMELDAEIERLKRTAEWIDFNHRMSELWKAWGNTNKGGNKSGTEN